MATNDTNTDDAALQALVNALNDIQAKAKQLAQNLTVKSGAPAASAGNGMSSALTKILGQQAGVSIASLLSGGNTAAGGANVVIRNNSSAAVSAQENSDGFDQKTLEITIDQMVANSLLRGRETSGVLRTLFGLVPTLIGR